MGKDLEWAQLLYQFCVALFKTGNKHYYIEDKSYISGMNLYKMRVLPDDREEMDG